MQREGVMVNDLPTIGGLTGGVGAAIAVVIWAGIKLREVLSKDKVTRAGDGATYDVIKMQSAQLDRAQEYISRLLASLDEAGKREAKMQRALEESNRQADGMRQEMSRMTDRIEALEKMVRSLGGTP